MSDHVYGAAPGDKCRRDLVVGATKSGKSWFASTYPRVFILNTDGSLDGLPGELFGKIGVWTLTDQIIREQKLSVYDAVMKKIESLRNNPVWKSPDGELEYEIGTIAIDGITVLGRMLLAECMNNVLVGGKRRDPIYSKATYDEYGALKTRLLNILQSLKDIPMNIVVTALDFAEKTENNHVYKIMPNVVGSVRDELGAFFNGVMYLERAGKSTYLYPWGTGKATMGTRNYVGPDKIENPSFGKVFKPEHFGGIIRWKE